MFCVTCNKLLSDKEKEYDSLKNHIGHSVILGDENN